MGADHHPDRKPGGERSLKPPPKPPRGPAAQSDDEDPTMRIFAREAVEASRLAELPPSYRREDALGPARRTSESGEPDEPQAQIPTLRPAALVEPEAAALPQAVAAPPAPARIPAPPPLPSPALHHEATPLAVEIRKHEAPLPPRAGHPFLRFGAALFAAGVLVGGLASAIVMTRHTARAAEATAATAAGVALATPAAQRAMGRAAEPSTATAAAKSAPEPSPLARAAAPTREPELPPVPRTNAATCEQLLGDRAAHRQAPRAAQRETRVANRALRRGNVDDAQLALCRALAWDRTSVDGHVNLARLFLTRRDWEQAAAYGRSALALEPTSRRALGAIGDALAALDKTDEARAALLAAERRPAASPSDRALIVRRDLALARRVERLHDYALAERLYRRVLLLSPDHPGATKGIASCLMRAGHYQAAEAWTRLAAR
jgi:tetratricopeptide (TPR) repeat protein